MKISAVHKTALTLNFILFSKCFQFLCHFFQYPRHKSAHISAHRQNKHIMWVFIFSVRTQGIVWYIFYFDPQKFFG